jgi:hypothetical protein
MNKSLAKVAKTAKEDSAKSQNESSFGCGYLLRLCEKPLLSSAIRAAIPWGAQNAALLNVSRGGA